MDTTIRKESPSVAKDVIEPREVAKVNPLMGLLSKAIPSLGGAPSKLERAPLDKVQTITDELPWVDYLPDYQQIVFADNITVMACYEIVPIPTEARSVPVLRSIIQDLIPLVEGVFPEKAIDPWVMGIYGDLDPRIDDSVMANIRDYASERAKGSEYTEDYIKMMDEHYRDITTPGGYFYDDLVTGSDWGGKTQRARVTVCRRYSRSRPKQDTSEELMAICEKLEDTFTTLGVSAKRLDGKGFYTWMRNWLNPEPASCGGDPRRLDEQAPWPGDECGDEDLPLSFDMGELVTLSQPVVDKKTGIWYLDGLPHVVLQAQSIVSPPYCGALTGEVEKNGKRFTTIDLLPANTVIALTIIFEPRDKTMSDIAKVKTSAKGDSEGARQTVREAGTIERYAEETREPLFPCELAFYIRGGNLKDLKRSVTTASTVLRKAGVRTYDPFMQKDPVRLGNFIRNLPGVYKPSIDRLAARRARLIHANHILRLAPLFGRSRGTGNPGMNLFNRTGEPLTIDLLSKKDSILNGHAFFYGMSGSGKSALITSFIDSSIAMHRPRIFAVDLGGSFGPFTAYAKSKGLSTHAMTLSMENDVSLPPFADAVLLADKREVDITTLPTDKQKLEELEVFKTGRGNEASEGRDIMGELEIIALQMIEGPNMEPIKSATLKVVIRRAIKLAADKAVDGELACDHPRPIDIVNCINEIGQRPEYKSVASEILEMASAMELFCAGLNDHLFNRKGKPWPEVDLTVLDLAQAAQTGRTETLVIAIISLIMHINKIAERDQHSGRPILFIIDEAHMVTGQELLMMLLTKVSKMWRKLGARLWVVTQNIADVPPNVKKMLGMMEYFISLKIPPNEIDLTREFRPITDEQAETMLQNRMNPGKYSEGCILQEDKVLQFRTVPPSLIFGLASTSPEEKAARKKVQDELGLSELDAIFHMTQQMRVERSRAH